MNSDRNATISALVTLQEQFRRAGIIRNIPLFAPTAALERILRDWSREFATPATC